MVLLKKSEESGMGEVTAVFWDVGGVILSNGWDRAARAEAAKKFGLDWEEFQDRHELASPDFESGRITLDKYRELPESRAVLSALARSGRYFLAAINNEPLELNVRRIEQFGLRRELKAF